MDFVNLSFGNAVIISLFSILVVFVVLLIISYMIDLTRLLLYRKKDKKDDITPVDTDTKVEELAEPEDKADGRTVAIISAAISAFLGKDSRFVIRKISRHKAPLSDWEAAGISDTQRRPL